MLDKLRSLLFEETHQTEPTLSALSAASALMFEVMWADHDIGEAEVKEMQQRLAKVFTVAPEQFDAILAETKRLHDAAVGLHEFTSVLNDILDAGEKYEVVKALWQIAYADQNVDVMEEHIIRRIADLMHVSHKDFIRAKLASRP